MRKLLLRALFFLIPFLYSIYVSSHPGKAKDCNTTCFSSEVVSVEKVSETCTSFELKVSFTDGCSHALSHFTVAVPCGQIGSIWNSGNWAEEIGTDPTTGLQGFKIDNISNFGKGSLSSFTVKFEICTSGEACAAEMRCWQPHVAYKASTCVNYETVEVNCQSLKASLAKKDASCFNANDGSLSVVVEAGQAPYTYLWSDNSTGESLSDLAAGSYSVVVRDQSGAEITLEETLSQPEEIFVSGTSTPASCNGIADGSIDLTITGGESPYAINWDNEMLTEDLENLLSGQYLVIVTDNNNCSATARFTVGTSSKMDIITSHIKPDCNSLNGAIDISVTGGTIPYSFLWSDNNITSEDRTDIGAGIYKVVVTDENGCTEQASILVKENNTLRVEATTASAGCNDEPSGGIDLTVTGGTAPYSYDWSNGTTGQDLQDIPSGYYTVKVTDEKGCVATQSYAVSKKTFQVPRTVQQPTCHDENNGAITLQEPIGGTGPFTYLWSTNGETGTQLTGLSPGVYSVTVRDATGCSRTLSSTIYNPSEIFVSATVSNVGCSDDGIFSVDLKVSGGTAPYTFQWSNGSDTEDLSGVGNGAYSVLITDAHGCTIAKEIVVEGGAAPWTCLITEPSGMPVCGSSDNTLSTPVTGADAYSWVVESTDGNWTVANADTPTVGFIAGGENSSATFTLTIVKDGCTRTCSYALTTCVPEDGGQNPDPGEEEPGSEQPGGEDPQGENPGGGGSGGEDPGDGEGSGEGDQSCDECFDTAANLVDVSGGCRTYEMQVSTNGLCRHELSHWTLAIPCGTVSNYSNSEGWQIESGKDPTTGLVGLKVDDINAFGKKADSFTVRFTVCAPTDCGLSSWNPIVAYKAGQCVDQETVDIDAQTSISETMSVYPNPFQETVNFEWSGERPGAHLQIIDQYGNTLRTVASSTRKGDGYSITLESTDLPKGMYYYRLIIGGKTYPGKISKR